MSKPPAVNFQRLMFNTSPTSEGTTSEDLVDSRVALSAAREEVDPEPYEPLARNVDPFTLSRKL